MTTQRELLSALKRHAKARGYRCTVHIPEKYGKYALIFATPCPEAPEGFWYIGLQLQLDSISAGRERIILPSLKELCNAFDVKVEEGKIEVKNKVWEKKDQK